MVDYANVDLTEEAIRSWLEFNKYNLDEEFLSFPMQIYRAGLEVALATNRLDVAKRHMMVIEAETEKHIRQNPTQYGINEKPTEKAIASVLLLTPEIIKENDKMLKAKEDLALMEAFRQALRDKLTSMTYMVKMYSDSYYADGRMPKEASEGKFSATRKEIEKGLVASKRLRR